MAVDEQSLEAFDEPEDVRLARDVDALRFGVLVSMLCDFFCRSRCCYKKIVFILPRLFMFVYAVLYN